MQNTKIKIDVVSDIACPWCFVGTRRFESAINEWKGVSIDVNWHPFQLDPSMRPEGMDRDTYLTSKFGSAEGVKGTINQLIEVGKTEGIAFNFGDDWLAVNTLHLHQLLHVANKEGVGVEMKERFLSAYFEKAQHLNKPEALYDITKDFGWNREM